jgi:hypothetical protein
VEDTGMHQDVVVVMYKLFVRNVRPQNQSALSALVKTNKSLIYSHYFDVQGDIKPSILELQTPGDLLQADIEKYDDTFMWRNLMEQEEAEKKHLDEQVTLRSTEFYSKCDGNFAGVIHWSERYPPVPAIWRREMVRFPKFHEDSAYEPTKECTARQKRVEVLQAPTYVKWNTEATCTCSTCGLVKIEYALLHPEVKGATLATFRIGGLCAGV